MAAAFQTSNTNPTLIERVDVHKSCKALETVVNAFNDYCQAAESLSLVQKKLAKALKDTAGMKATNELASNALNVVAQLLDALAEVDTKFVKIADKECDDASSDVRKWFKKLAKEEKNHDDRIAAANAKIKQAGQQYEKKAKRKDLSAAEEHSRYVTLLSVVGPELSQEKYNHSLSVSQRHLSTIYNVTSNISRVADAEWQRVCECVRRFSPLIGRIGECRAFIEGGWTNDLPAALSSDPSPTSNGVVEKERAPISEQVEMKSDPSPSASSVSGHSGQRTPAPAYSYAPSVQAQAQRSQTGDTRSTNDSASTRHQTVAQHRPPPSSFNAANETFNADSVRSIESLSSFPAPPAHFPIPSLTSGSSPSPLSQVQSPPGASEVGELGKRNTSGYFGQSTQPLATSDPRSRWAKPDRGDDAINPAGPVVESPRSLGSEPKPETPMLPEDSGRSPIIGQGEPSIPGDESTMLASAPKPISGDNRGGEQERLQNAAPDIDDNNAPQRPKIVNSEPSVTVGINEFGQRPQIDTGTEKYGMERSESITSTTSVVASMRDKLIRGQNLPQMSSSTKDRDIPRATGKVSDLASRYTPVNDTPPSPISPRAIGRNSPIAERTRVAPILERRIMPNELIEGHAGRETLSASPYNQLALNDTRPLEDEIMARRRRIVELEELERREQAHVLRLRERELEQRSLEIQREREQLQEYGARPRVNSVVNGVKGTIQLPARPHSQYSYSTTNLPITRTPTAIETPSRPVSQYGELVPPVQPQASASSSSVSIPRPPQDHAPYCGCYACSAAQYGAPPRPQSSSNVDAKPDKPKGWIRRLSMPVGNAFGSDSKSSKGNSNKSIGILPDDPMLRMKPSFERDATGGISNVRPRKLSFGRR